MQTFLVITVQLFQLFGFSLFSFLISFGLALEPYCEGSDRLRAAGCHGNGVFGPEEICAQRSCSTQLHVSHRHVGSSSSGISPTMIFGFHFLASGWTSRTRSRWQTLAWPEMFWTKSITAFRITGRRSCPSSGWPLRVYRPKNSPPNQMW